LGVKALRNHVDEIESHQGTISPTCLCQAFMRKNPKSVKIQSSSQYLFALLGSAYVKAARKTLMKLNPIRALMNKNHAHLT
jgi:hypothetical protein